VISPETSDHPLPGKRSYQAGISLLGFFGRLRREKARELIVFLSGGASSLAWLRPKGISERELRVRLTKLYRRPMTIRQLNRERSRLCLLKAGGALRLLKILAPGLRVKVVVLSDVSPYGVEIVGSGPFLGARHILLADNRTLAQAARRRFKEEKILDFRHSQMGSEKKWALALEKKIARALRSRQEGVLIWAGEPQVELPKKTRGHGGRQTQLAARLALRFWDEIRSGRVEILCGSSDGRDGTSESAATHLSRHSGHRIKKMNPSLQRQLKKAIECFDTAPLLRRNGFLIPAYSTGTNLQDLVLIRVMAS